jgi:hypothetical protein
LSGGIGPFFDIEHIIRFNISMPRLLYHKRKKENRLCTHWAVHCVGPRASADREREKNLCSHKKSNPVCSPVTAVTYYGSMFSTDASHKPVSIET